MRGWIWWLALSLLACGACIDRGERPRARMVGGDASTGSVAAGDASSAERPEAGAAIGEAATQARNDASIQPAALVELETPLPPIPERLIAPARFAEVIPRLGFPYRRLYGNLTYEGNNPNMRGRRASSGLYHDQNGAVGAGRWRRAAASVAGLFVLRDSLFSQQDHPLDHRAFAPMIPQNWVTAAVAEVLEGRTPRPLRAPALEDDAAWTALNTPGAMFGSFPASQRLHGWATRSRDGVDPVSLSRIENARHTVIALAEQARAMVDVAGEGPEAVARAGAEQISVTDRLYFTTELRRNHVIPIGVENPNRHEIEDEGKGLEIAGRTVPRQAIALARDAIYRRRLRDGDIAIERYDISQPAERRRGIAFLERLVPSVEGGATGGHLVWLWVTGPQEANAHLGVDATAYFADFRAEAERASIDMSRVRFLSKPSVVLATGNRGPALAEQTERLRRLGLPISVNLATGMLERAIASAPPEG